MQELLTGVILIPLLCFFLIITTFSHMDSCLSYCFIYSKTIAFLIYLQSLNLLELAAYLKDKVAQLRNKGLGRIKMALAGMNTSSLLEILEGHFGHMDLDTSKSTISTEKSEKEVTTEENHSHHFLALRPFCDIIASFHPALLNFLKKLLLAITFNVITLM